MLFGLMLPRSNFRFTSEHLNFLKSHFDYIIYPNAFRAWRRCDNKDINLLKMRKEKDEIILLNHGISSLLIDVADLILEKFPNGFLVNKPRNVRKASDKGSPQNISVSKTYGLPLYTDIISALKYEGLPIICKPRTGYKGQGIIIVETYADIPLHIAIQDTYVYQKYIPRDERVCEYRLQVVGYKVINAVKRIYEGEEEMQWRYFNLGDNPKLSELVNISEEIAKLFGLESCAVDFMSIKKKVYQKYNLKNKWMYLETNTAYGIGEFTINRLKQRLEEYIKEKKENE